MKPEDLNGFVDLMDETALIKNTRISPLMVKAWFNELKRFDLDVLQKALTELRQEKWGFPDIAEVFGAAGDLQRDKEWADYHNSPEQVRERELLARSGNTGPERVAKILSDIKTVGGKA